jgi:hypothetical protein
MIRLPVSGAIIEYLPPTGEDDLALLEGSGGWRAAGALATRRVVGPDGEPIDVGELPVGDLDVIVVELRRRSLGDSVVGEATCAACGSRVDVALDLASYLQHCRPRPSRRAVPTSEPGCWRLRSGQLEFRLPKVADVLEAAGSPDPRKTILERCIHGVRTAAGIRSAERTMAGLGPTLLSQVAGLCPECGASAELSFDAREFCLQELRSMASGVIEETHLLAWAYHWSERQILALAPWRRRAYAELVSAGMRGPASLASRDRTEGRVA